jgi:hypothetical protein
VPKLPILLHRELRRPFSGSSQSPSSSTSKNTWHVLLKPIGNLYTSPSLRFSGPWGLKRQRSGLRSSGGRFTIEVELPNAKAIFPYLGLFTMVTINPTQATGNSIPMPYLPSLSIIRGFKFVKAPSNTSPTAKKAARIFQSKAIDNNTPITFGTIPLSHQDQAFTETRYWRLPVSAAAIFAVLIERLAADSSECEDIMLANNIWDILNLQSRNAYPLDDDARGSPSGGGPSGGGGRGGSKRKDTGGESSSSPGKGKKKARKASGGGDGTGDCGELITTFQLPLQNHPAVPNWQPQQRRKQAPGPYDNEEPQLPTTTTDDPAANNNEHKRLTGTSMTGSMTGTRRRLSTHDHPTTTADTSTSTLR